MAADRASEFYVACVNYRTSTKLALAAAIVASTSASVWAADTNIASNWLQGG
jgi:hypothetical protein